MLKYLNTQVTFSEFPDEISLCINITRCPNHCPGCHSPELWEDVGEILDIDVIFDLIDKNDGISCIGFMGGDQDVETINTFAKQIHSKYPKLKIGWYSGRSVLPEEIDCNNFDYIKLGPYIKEKGPIDDPKTNQRMLVVRHYLIYNYDNNKQDPQYILTDVTDKFWKTKFSKI